MINQMTINQSVLNQKAFNEALSRFFPVESVDKIRELVAVHHFQLKFRHGRATKLGDFRPAINGKPHQITINSDMNVYACLLIFLHELAHLLVWEHAGRQAQPHGQPWKDRFGQLIRDFSGKGLFHPSLKDSLMHYSWRVRASGIGSDQLLKQLQAFDQDDEVLILLDDLPDQSHFLTRTGRLFRKEEQLRKRYKCFCLDNKRTYLFHPMARVQLAPEMES